MVIGMMGQMPNMVQEANLAVWEAEEAKDMEIITAGQGIRDDGAVGVWFDMDGTTYYAEVPQGKQRFDYSASSVLDAGLGDTGLVRYQVSGQDVEHGPGVEGPGGRFGGNKPGDVVKVKVQDPGDLMLPETEFTRYNASENRKNQIIMIDPGHGNPHVASLVPNFTEGNYFGGRGDQLNGETEQSFALAVGERIRDKLLAAGYDVIMSRDTNDALTPNKLRAKMASEAGCILHVCIHWNASGRSGVNGTLKAVPPDYNSRSWVWEMERLWSLCGPRLGAYLGSGVQHDYIFPGAVFNIDADLPVLYIETGFMTGSIDSGRLTGDANHEGIAEAIASGIIDYYSQAEPVREAGTQAAGQAEETAASPVIVQGSGTDGGPGESAGVSEESAGTPEESAGTPEESAGTPEESAGTPVESADAPEESSDVSEESAGLPEA